MLRDKLFSAEASYYFVIQEARSERIFQDCPLTGSCNLPKETLRRDATRFPRALLPYSAGSLQVNGKSVD